MAVVTMPRRGHARQGAEALALTLATLAVVVALLQQPIAAQSTTYCCKCASGGVTLDGQSYCCSGSFGTIGYGPAMCTCAEEQECSNGHFVPPNPPHTDDDPSHADDDPSHTDDDPVPPGNGAYGWEGTYTVDTGGSPAECCSFHDCVEVVATGQLTATLTGAVAGSGCGSATTLTMDMTLASADATTATGTVGSNSYSISRSGTSVTVTDETFPACSGTATCGSGACEGGGSTGRGAGCSSNTGSGSGSGNLGRGWAGSYTVTSSNPNAPCCSFPVGACVTVAESVTDPLQFDMTGAVVGLCGGQTSVTIALTLLSEDATTASGTAGTNSYTVTRSGSEVTVADDSNSQCSGTGTCESGACMGGGATGSGDGCSTAGSIVNWVTSHVGVSFAIGAGIFVPLCVLVCYCCCRDAPGSHAGTNTRKAAAAGAYVPMGREVRRGPPRGALDGAASGPYGHNAMHTNSRRGKGRGTKTKKAKRNKGGAHVLVPVSSRSESYMPPTAERTVDRNVGAGVGGAVPAAAAMPMPAAAAQRGTHAPGISLSQLAGGDRAPRQRFCVSCGTRLQPATARFCVSCGARVPGTGL